jgi:methylated-DNA-[protein]-cysteine S-methyltransferase
MTTTTLEREALPTPQPPAHDVAHTVLDTSLGALTIVATPDALVGLYFEQHRHLPDPSRFGPLLPADDPRFAAVARELAEFLAGSRNSFDVLVAPRGTAFQERVWDALTRIPFGETTTYGRIAAELGNPRAVRAVGLAVGRNPVSIVVPCHRVVGSTGALTGYAGGVERKRALLDLEGALPA